ncbi:hypothetical protein ACPWR0_23375 [Pandoraea pneumonica]|uniref:hypothetical protein n=1 Tax=Pandoraea pneumonica TaxID=2508299 RepID=UPI003CEFDBCD
MKSNDLSVAVEDFLFGHGLSLANYFIEQTPVSEMLCYVNAEGREFDLPINDPELASAVLIHLKNIGVRVVKID